MKTSGLNIEKILQNQRKEYQRYLGTFSENIESQVRLITETMGGVQQQLTAIRDMVARNTEDVEEMKIELRVVRNDVKRQASRDEYSLLENRVAKLEKAMGKR